MLELPRRVQEVVRVRLGRDLTALWLLDEVLVALLLGKVDGVLLGVEVQVRALHVVARRLPAHEGVFPAVALVEDVPVHAPVRAAPVAGLGGGLGLFVDAGNGTLAHRQQQIKPISNLSLAGTMMHRGVQM